MQMFLRAFLFCAFLLTVSSRADADAFTVADVTSPTSLVSEAGEVYVLEGIRVPDAEHDRAQKWLTDTLRGHTIEIMAVPGQTHPLADRWGKTRIHATYQKAWIQTDMLAQGLAIVDIASDQPTFTQDLLAREEEARSAHRGLWANADLYLYHPETLGDIRNRFLIVEGRIKAVARRKDVVYLNFGPDWKTDFTLRLPKDNVRAFPRGFPRDTLSGSSVRVRGWVYERNGPMIDLLHPSQIEFLTPATRKQP